MQVDLELIRKASYIFKSVWELSNQLSDASYPVRGTMSPWGWLRWLHVVGVCHVCVCLQSVCVGNLSMAWTFQILYTSLGEVVKLV